MPDFRRRFQPRDPPRRRQGRGRVVFHRTHRHFLQRAEQGAAVGGFRMHDVGPAVVGHQGDRHALGHACQPRPQPGPRRLQPRLPRVIRRAHRGRAVQRDDETTRLGGPARRHQPGQRENRRAQDQQREQQREPAFQPPQPRAFLVLADQRVEKQQRAHPHRAAATAEQMQHHRQQRQPEPRKKLGTEKTHRLKAKRNRPGSPKERPCRHERRAWRTSARRASGERRTGVSSLPVIPRPGPARSRIWPASLGPRFQPAGARKKSAAYSQIRNAAHNALKGAELGVPFTRTIIH